MVKIKDKDENMKIKLIKRVFDSQESRLRKGLTRNDDN